MNESTSLLNSKLSGNPITYATHIQPALNDKIDNTKPSKPLGDVKYHIPKLNTSNEIKSRMSMDLDDEDPNISRDFWTRALYCLDLSNETSNRIVYWGLLLALISLTSVERVTFKMVVDKMTPYRWVVEIVIMSCLTAAYAAVVFYKGNHTAAQMMDITKIPPIQLFFMALLDMAQFSGLIIAAEGITPTMTLILLHASTPCIAISSKYLFPERKIEFYGPGFYLITSAIFITIIHPIVALCTGHTSAGLVVSTILYAFAACIQGYSMVYKEYALPAWSSPPLDIHFVSLCLFSLQTLLIIILSPIIYLMQDVTAEGSVGFPIASYPKNFFDGIDCLFGYTPTTLYKLHPPYNDNYVTCDNQNIWLVLGYVFSNVAILVCVDVILKRRQDGPSLERAMIVAVFVAFLALGVYDTKANYGLGLFGSNIGIIDIVALVALMTGMEISNQSLTNPALPR